MMSQVQNPKSTSTRKRSKSKNKVSIHNQQMHTVISAQERLLWALQISNLQIKPQQLTQPIEIYRNPSVLSLNSQSQDKTLENVVEYRRLDVFSGKFIQIKNQFPPGLKVLKIEQVFNPFARLSFQFKQHFVYSDVKPKKLFHGTKLRYVHNICTYNFDWRYFGMEKGHRWGKGVNFTSKPLFAMNFCDKKCDVKVLILCDVLINNCTMGSDFVAVPPNGFDTTVSDKGVCWVKFDDAEFYPSYVIFYRKV